MKDTRRAGRARLGLKVALDVAVWTLAGYLAFPLRAPGLWMELQTMTWAFPLVTIPVALPLVLTFRLERQVWARVTVEDLREIVLAVVLGTGILFVVGLVWQHQGAGFPRGVPLIQGVLALLGMAGMRAVIRLRDAHQWRLRPPLAEGRSHRVLLAGAGSAGTRIGREIRRHPDTGIELVGFLDDDRAKAGLRIAEAHVIGGLEDLPSAVRFTGADEVLITMPSAPGIITRRVLDLATQTGVPCRILPGVTEMLADKINFSRIRRVQVEDLLRREPVDLDLPGGGEYVTDGTVMVTGAGGSIGSELVRQVARLRPRRLIMYGHGENTLHEVEQELGRTMPGLVRHIILGDIRDPVKIAWTMRRFEPDVVFHAAAHKHVPLMEGNPDEAILNNVGGTRNLADAALAAGVKRFVNVSTDKAVSPTSMLGVTKSLAERVVRCVGAEARSGQAFVSVRFGNVLGSRGSVVPVFQEQIRRGGPLLVTDPAMTRYFMTIPEASRLVIQAGALGENGSVYVLDMGAPVRIVDLARDMIHLAGADDGGVEIEFTGLRPGEKLHEELFTDNEELGTTGYEQIMVTHHEPLEDDGFTHRIDQLIRAAERRDWAEMDRWVRLLVPEYEPRDWGGHVATRAAVQYLAFPKEHR